VLIIGSGNALTTRPTAVYWDANLDDVAALLYLLDQPEYQIEYICASGTGFSDSWSGVNTGLRILESKAVDAETAGQTELAQYYRSIAVAEGSSVPLSGMTNLNAAILNAPVPIRLLTATLWFTIDSFFPTSGSLSPSLLSCDQLLNQAIDTYGNKVEIFNSGTFTDLAGSADQISVLKNKVYMGGVLTNGAGNVFTLPGINQEAEFNIFLDPTAADVVLRYKESRAPLLVGLEATTQLPVTREFLNETNNLTSLHGRWINAYLNVVKDFFGEESFFNDNNQPGGGYYLWDLIAALIHQDKTCVSEEKGPLTVDQTEGPADPSGKLLAIDDLNYRENGKRVTTRYCTLINDQGYQVRILDWMSS